VRTDALAYGNDGERSTHWPAFDSEYGPGSRPGVEPISLVHG
jgi:hypothetical protein